MKKFKKKKIKTKKLKIRTKPRSKAAIKKEMKSFAKETLSEYEPKHTYKGTKKFSGKAYKGKKIKL